MTEQFTNGAQTTLNGAINNSVTSLVVTSAAGFPTVGEFRILIVAEGANTDEILLVTGVSGTTFTVVRAYEAIADGTQVAQSHATAATVAHVLTAGSLRTAMGANAGFIGASVSNSVLQTITTGGSGEAITFDTEQYDTDGFHSTSVNTSRMTIPAGLGGKYLCIAGGGFNDPEASGVVYYTKNGSPSAVQVGGGSVTTTRLDIQAVEIFDLVAGDYIELWAFHAAGADRDFGTGVASYFRIVKLDSGKVGSGIGAQAYNSTTQSVNDSTETALTLDSEIFDTDGFHSTSSDTSRMTIPAGLGGKYLIIGNAYMAPDADGVRVLTFRKNGTTSLRHGSTIVPSSANSINVTASTVADLAAGEYVELIALHTAGAALNVGHASSLSAQTTFSIMRLDSGTSAYTGSRWGSGIAFPSGPITGDRFRRTDRNMDYVYDGTQWLSADVFILPMGAWANSATYTITISATTAAVHRGIVSVAGDLATDIWLEAVESVNFIAGGTALSASHKWVATIFKIDAADSGTSIATLTIDSGAANNWHRRTVAIDALLGTVATYSSVRIAWTKTGTPGTLDVQIPPVITYRLVG
jgi:hypothetical protein